MIEGTDLEALAKKAKQQLKEQDTNLNIKNTEVNSDIIQDSVELKNTPTEKSENPTLSNEPSEDYEEEENPKLFSYDEPLFPNGPTKTQIDSWKKQWEGYDIYAVEVMNQYFVFRTINRFEYKQLVALQNVDPLQREEIICETVTLWPRTYKWDVIAIEKAGIPSTFAQIIMDKSGFTKEYSIQVL